MFYLTLDEALQDVARRSFYEDCKVTPLVMADSPDDGIRYFAAKFWNRPSIEIRD